MRSRTDPTLHGRCPRCWLVRRFCICDRIPTVETELELVIVRHHIEGWRSSGTARLVGLALPGVELIEFGTDAATADAALAARLAARPLPTALLFPDGGSGEPSGAPPRRLIVPDGTWREARRMLRRLPSTWGLPRLALPAAEPAALRLRRAPAAASRSTVEAIADALALLDDPSSGAKLRELHRYFVEQGLRARGTFTYHSTPARSGEPEGSGEG